MSTDSSSRDLSTVLNGPRQHDQDENGATAPRSGTNASVPDSAARVRSTAALFDPARLRLAQDFSSDVGVRKVLASVLVGKPPRQTFFRVHADPGQSLVTALVDLKSERETYLVDPSLRHALAGEIVVVKILFGITRQNVPFLWPLRMPGADGRLDNWTHSAHEGAERATKRWVRLNANMQLGAYEIIEAIAELGEPSWPEDLTFEKALELGFRDRYIDSLDHPVIRRLRGEAP